MNRYIASVDVTFVRVAAVKMSSATFQFKGKTALVTGAGRRNSYDH